MKKDHFNVNTLLTEWLVLLTCFGYPIQAMFVVIFRHPSAPINLGFRMIYFLISLYLIWTGISKKHIRLTAPLIVFILFWLIYSGRLIYDLEYKRLAYMDKSSFYIYAWAFGCSLIPTLAVFFNARIIDIKRLQRNIFNVLLIANLCIIISLLFFSRNGILGIFSERTELVIEINGVMVNILNAITISLFGELLSLVSIIFLIVKKQKLSILNWAYYLATLSLGISNLLIGASRGPLISFILILLFMPFAIANVKTFLFNIYLKLLGIFRKIERKQTTKVNCLKPIIWILIALVVAAFLIVFLKKNPNIALLNRMEDFSQSGITGEKVGRVNIWMSAWKQFLENPILGDSFVTKYANTYAHNLILESLMATGIIGAIFYLYYICNPFFLYFIMSQDKRRAYLVLWIMFFSFFLLSMTSGGLFSSPEIWILSALIIGQLQKSKPETKIDKQAPTIVPIS